jgi:PHD/YefM family antitoxin component YafN of YafNO toxin-antitoxin module
MQVTATEAKNRFGYVCARAKAEPVFVEKDGRIDSVILSVQDFEALKAASQPKTLAARQKAFNQAHKAWIDEQNARFEKNGLWCDDLRVW